MVRANIMRQIDTLAVFPSAGEILGTVVGCLASDNENLKSQTARRYFSGDSIKPENQREILSEFAATLVRDGIVPESEVLSGEGLAIADLIARGLENLSEQWNHLVSKLESSTSATARPVDSWFGITRILVPDLALRIFGLLRLVGTQAGPDSARVWMSLRGEAMVLRKHLTGAGLSREDLAAEIQVSDGSVDNWFDGRNPVSIGLFNDLVEVLASRQSTGNRQQATGEIRREIFFARIFNELVVVFGEEKSEEIVNTLTRMIAAIERDVAKMGRPPIQEMCRAEIDCVIGGALDRNSGVLLRNIALLEEDPEWKEDLKLATLDWKLQAQRLMARLHQAGTSAGLAMEYASLFDTETGSNSLPEIDLEAMQAIDVIAPLMDWEGTSSDFPDFTRFIDRFRRYVDDYRRLAQRFPGSAYAHSQSGSMIGKLAEFLPDPGLVEEAIGECKIAAIMHPKWDLPNVEIGIILANHRRFDDAYVELEESLQRMQVATPHFAYTRGYVLENLGRYSEALADYEFVLSHAPDYAIALDGAAHCAFVVSDNKKGMRYAKKAHLRGESKAYTAWRNGEYRKTR